MKLKQEVKRHLAMLLTAAILLASMPVSSFMAMAFEKEDPDGEWKFTKIWMDGPQGGLKVGQSGNFSFTGEVAGVTVATDSNGFDIGADAIEDVKAQMAGLSKDDFTVDDENGSLEIMWDEICPANNEELNYYGIAIPVKGVKAGTATITWREDPGVSYTVEVEAVPVVTGLTVVPEEVVLDLAGEKTAVITVTAETDRTPTEDTYYAFANGLSLNWKGDTSKPPVAEIDAEIEKMTATITLTGIQAGSDELEIKYDGRPYFGMSGQYSVTVPVTIKDSREEESKSKASIVGIELSEKELITIDMSDEEEASNGKKFIITPIFSEGATEVEKEELAEIFYDRTPWVDVYVENPEKDGKKIEVANFSWEGSKTNLKAPYTSEAYVRGVSEGAAVLVVRYEGEASGDKELRTTCKIEVKKAEIPVVTESMSYPNTGDMEAPKAEDLMKDVPEATIDAKEVTKQIEAIKTSVRKAASIPMSESLVNTVESELAKTYADATTISILPSVKYDELKLQLVDDKVLVTNVKMDLTVYVIVDGNNVGELNTVTGRKDYIPVKVAVPEEDARGGLDGVKWTHYTDDARTKVDNSVMRSTLTQITNGTTTIYCNSFSPFDMEFTKYSTGYIPSNSGAGSGASIVSAKTGIWKQNETGWWYEYSDGTYPKSSWKKLSYNNRTDWYYFDADGYMKTGWIQDGGLWYYLNPVSDGTMGAMKTGWIQDGGLWYYLNPVSDDTMGAMKTGWIQDGNLWYYLSDIPDGTRGHMLASTMTPDGYQVGADGARLQ